MTISFRGATGLTANTVVAVTWTLPGNLATNDLILACYSGKPFNATFGATNPPSGYTALGSAVSGAVASGVGTGSNHTIAYYKVHNGAEGATMTGTVGVAPTPSMAAVAGFRSTRAGTAWAAETTVGTDVVVTGTTFSALGSASLAFYPGKTLVVIVGTPDDVSATTTWAVTASGITFGTASQALGTVVTGTSNDGSLDVIWFPVTAGVGTVTPTFTMTTSSGDSNGAATFVLLTEPQAVTGVVAGTATTSGTIAGKEGALGVVTGTSNTSGIIIAPDKGGLGVVTGSSNTSGTIVGTKVIPSNDKTGTVAGTSNTSGTVVGAKATTGTVTGTSNTSGTITAPDKGGTGTVTGSSSTSGTDVGTAGRKGAIAATSTTSGTVVGTKYEPPSDNRFGTVTGSSGATGTVTGTAARTGTVTGSSTTSGSIGTPPPSVAPTGGMSAYRRAQIAAANLQVQQEAARVANARSGSVHGASSTTGHARGHAGRSGRTLSSTSVTYRTRTTGTTTRTTRVTGRTQARGHLDGDAVYPMSTRALRQARDDAELLLLI